LRGYPYERSNEIDKDVELYWLDLELEAYRKHLGAKSARLAGAELCVFRNIRGRAQITPLRGFPPFARPIRDDRAVAVPPMTNSSLIAFRAISLARSAPGAALI